MSDVLHHRTYRHERLRIRFGDFFAVVSIVTLAVANTLVWTAFGVRDPWVYLLAVPATVLLMAAVAVLILRRQFTLDLTPESVRCCDFWGKYHVVPWESIRSAKVWYLMGLPYLRMETGRVRRPLWMSLSIENAEALPDLLASYVEPEHPMRVAVRNFR